MYLEWCVDVAGMMYILPRVTSAMPGYLLHHCLNTIATDLDLDQNETLVRFTILHVLFPAAVSTIAQY